MKQNLFKIVAVGIPLILSQVSLADDTLYAAFASMDITPPKGVPLAGFGGGNRRLIPWDVFNKHKYATFLKPSDGKLDPIRAKVLVLKKGSKKLLFLGLDVVAFTKDNRSDVIKALKGLEFGDDEVFISATHTHSGPGTMSKNFAWEVLAADKFQPKIYNQILDNIFLTTSFAMANLKPAELYQSKFKVTGLQKNRRVDNGPVDDETQMLIVKNKDNGAILGALFNLAIHGTALKMANLKYSSDVNGSMERAFEAELEKLNGSKEAAHPVAIHINGAEGDVSPAKSGTDGMESIGHSFVEQAIPAVMSATPISDDDWSVAHKDVKLISPGLNLKGCAKQKTVRALLWKKLRLGLGLWFPKKAPIYSLKLGPIFMMTWPGEATTALGLALKSEAKAAGFSEPWVMGLTNEYLAYWTTKEEYNKSGYEACNSLYGEKGGSTIIAGHKSLFEMHAKATNLK